MTGKEKAKQTLTLIAGVAFEIFAVWLYEPPIGEDLILQIIAIIFAILGTGTITRSGLKLYSNYKKR